MNQVMLQVFADCTPLTLCQRFKPRWHPGLTFLKGVEEFAQGTTEDLIMLERIGNDLRVSTPEVQVRRTLNGAALTP